MGYIGWPFFWDMGFFMILGFREDGPAREVLVGLTGERRMEFGSERGMKVIRLE